MDVNHKRLACERLQPLLSNCIFPFTCLSGGGLLMASWVKHKASVCTNSWRAPWKHQTHIGLTFSHKKKAQKLRSRSLIFFFFLWSLSLFESWFIVPAVLIVCMLMRLDAGWYLLQENTLSLLKTKHLRHWLRFPDSEHFVFTCPQRPGKRGLFWGLQKNNIGGYLGQPPPPQQQQNNGSSWFHILQVGLHEFRKEKS